MIQYVKRDAIDLTKYNNCVATAIQSRIYAYSWYLDVVAENWDVLVLNDYEAVVPLPFKVKFQLKHISQPFFCQQLGVFSKKILSEELQRELLLKIPFKFLKIALNLNSNNTVVSTNTSKINYILQLSAHYATLHKGFSKGRKHAVKVGEKAGLEIRAISILELIAVHHKNYKYTIPESILKQLVATAVSKEKGQVIGVFKGKELLGGSFLLNDEKRITYLYAAFNEEGRKLQAASFLISYIIKKHQESYLVLDFEGGILPNVGKFYRSFGAKEEIYSTFNKLFL